MANVFRVVWGWGRFEDHSTLQAAQISADKMLPAGMKFNKRDSNYSVPYVLENVEGEWKVAYDPAGFMTKTEEE